MLFYKLYGTGNIKILMMQGLVSGIGGWLEQIDYFKQYGKKYQLCVFDNPGIGHSQKYDHRLTTKILATLVNNIVEEIGWNKFHLVGFSMGGMIAQQYTLKYKHKILSLTLAVTHRGYTLPPLKCYYHFFKILFSYEARLYNMFSKNYIKNNYQECIDMINKKIEYDKIAGITTFLNHLFAIFTHKISDQDLDYIKDLPIWICTGTHDNLVNPKNSYNLIKKLNPQKCTIYNDAGHCINLERKTEFNFDLREFIEWVDTDNKIIVNIKDEPLDE